MANHHCVCFRDRRRCLSAPMGTARRAPKGASKKCRKLKSHLFPGKQKRGETAWSRLFLFFAQIWHSEAIMSRCRFMVNGHSPVQRATPYCSRGATSKVLALSFVSITMMATATAAARFICHDALSCAPTGYHDTRSPRSATQPDLDHRAGSSSLPPAHRYRLQNPDTSVD